MALVIAITKEVNRQFKAQGRSKALVVPKRVNSIIAAADSIVEQFAKSL